MFRPEFPSAPAKQPPHPVRLAARVTQRASTPPLPSAQRRPAAAATLAPARYSAASRLPLRIQSIFPTVAPLDGGTQLEIMGDGFAEDSRVFVGRHECAIILRQDTSLHCIAPEQSRAGSYTVTVATHAGLITSTDTINYGRGPLASSDEYYFSVGAFVTLTPLENDVNHGFKIGKIVQGPRFGVITLGEEEDSLTYEHTGADTQLDQVIYQISDEFGRSAQARILLQPRTGARLELYGADSFPDTPVGQRNKSVFRLKNVGDAVTDALTFSLVGNAFETLEDSGGKSCGLRLRPGEECEWAVVFSPGQPGLFQAEMGTLDQRGRHLTRRRLLGYAPQ